MMARFKLYSASVRTVHITEIVSSCVVPFFMFYLSFVD
jgi:hypothetical protein